MAEDRKKQLINIGKLSTTLLFIAIFIALGLIMAWSSNQIQIRRQAYLEPAVRAAAPKVERQERPLPAEQAVEQPTAQGEQNAEFYFNEGLRYARSGRFDEAVKALEKCIDLSPQHYRAMSNLGLVYKNIFLTNRNPEILDKAIEWYNKALKTNPNFSEVYNNLGDAYFNQGDYAKAEKTFKEAIRLDPLSINAYNNLGVALILQDKKEEAIEYWRKSLEVNPNQPHVQDYILRNE